MLISNINSQYIYHIFFHYKPYIAVDFCIMLSEFPWLRKFITRLKFGHDERKPCVDF